MSNRTEEIQKRVPGARVYRRERSKYWQIQYRKEDGTPVRLSSGERDEAAAWEVLDELYTRVTSLSFQDAVVSFFESKQRNLKSTTLRGYLFALQAVDPFFSKMVLQDIQLPQIREFVTSRRREVSDTTVRRELAFLSSVFSHAQVELEGAPETNPIKAYSKRHLKENRREYYLTHSEFEVLREVCNLPWQQMVITTAVYTGMRHQELCQLRKSWINWDRGETGEIQLPREYTKSDRPRIIPIFPELSNTLHEWCRNSDSPWVFSHGDPAKPYTSFQGFFRLARERAGMKELRFHDLRHTFASWWVQRGGSLMVLKDILGHTSLQMVQRYAHLDTEASHREMAKMAAHTLNTQGDV